MPLVWVNITTSLNWNRPPVGIVRVERSLAVELKKIYGDRFRQCVWHDGEFVEYQQSNLEQQIEIDENVQNHNKRPANAHLPPIYPILPKKQALISIAQGLLSLAPEGLRDYLNKLLYLLRPKIGLVIYSQGIRRFFRKKNAHIDLIGVDKNNARDQKKDSVIFGVNDVLISVGLDWDHPYYKSFYSLRKDRGVKIITCCYDLIPVLYPQYCVNDVAGIFTSYFLELADSSDLILCISKQSEKDLNNMLERTGGARPVTKIFPLGDSVPQEGSEKISEAVESICNKPFILYVSTIERRKNHEVLYRAYHLLHKQGRAKDLPKLVFVGMQGWGVSDLLKDIELDPLTKYLIVRLNHVNDSELKKLYESSLFCVFPSLYEGWGLPVGEALSLGKVVLSSNSGSLPEVGADLVQYLKPWDVEGWANQLLKLSEHHSLRNELQDRIKEHYKPRTWSDCALAVKREIDLLNAA